MFKHISRYFVHISWYLLVFTFVLCSLLISLIWLTSSSIDDLRPKILEWVNTSTGQPIEVGSLDVKWHGVIPYLKLTDVEVFDRNSHQSLTRFDQAELSVDLYRSLTEWKLSVGHLSLSGLNLELVHKEDGTISLLGLTEKASSGDEFSRWLLEQSHLKITNSNIIWHEEPSQKKIALKEVNLELTKKPLINQHQLKGSTRFVESQSEIKFDLKIKGDPLESNWDADLILITEELDLNPYLPADINERLSAALQNDLALLNNPKLNSNTHISWKKAEISELNGSFSFKNAAPVYSISSDFTASKLSSNNGANGWQISMPQLRLGTFGHPWQPLSLQIQLPSNFSIEKPELALQINKLKIEDLNTLLPESIIEKIADYKFEGNLNNLRLHYDQKDLPTSILFESEFSDLNIPPHNKIPGFKNLSGKFLASKNSFTLDLNSQNVLIDRLLRSGGLEPSIKLDKLNGQLEWKNSDQGWKVSIPQITLSNPDLEFQLTGSIKKDIEKSPDLDLHGTFFRGNAEPLVKMIPANLLQDEVNEWLDRSIISGRLTGGNVVFSGNLADFPFDQNNGIFEVRLSAEDGILDYFEGWPRVEEITAEIVFDSQKMVITSPSAKIYNADVQDTVVEIPELAAEKHHLLISGTARGDMKDGLQFVYNSPLKTSVGKQLKYLKIDGDLNLDLKLDLQLSDIEASKVEGNIHLNKNDLLLESLGIQLNALNGDFIFDQNRWRGKNLKARLYESAIKIHLDIEQDKKNAKSDVKLTGIADRNYVINRMIQIGMDREQLKVLNSMSGTTTWQAQLSLPSNIGDPNEETGLLITSDLKGLNIQAPAPLGKLANENRQLKIITTLSDKPKRQVKFEYSDIVSGNIEFETQKQNTELKKVAVHFDQKKSPKLRQNNKHKIIIDGHIKTLDFSSWLNFYDQYFASEGSPIAPENNLLGFDLNIDQIRSFGQNYNNNQIQGMSSVNSWEIMIKNDSAKGAVSIPYDTKINAIKADFERIKIVSSKNDKQKLDLNPKGIPELILTSQSFQFNDLKLGSLQMHLKPEIDGLNIEQLTFSSTAANIDIKGRWTTKNKQQRSEFTLLTKAAALSPMLKQFDLGATKVEGGKTKISINANWQGSPTDFDLTNLKGSVKLKVGAGRFTEVNNTLGKIFGLVSLQSLRRRLSLNFNDLFQKGFTFDNISGNFDLENGNAYTNNLNMIGPSANIDITGRIGLSDQDYDQRIIVTPSVTDSLPIAGAVFGPVGIGVGAVIVLAKKLIPVLPNVIDKVLERQYSLTGSWEKPLIEPVVKKSENNTSSPLK